MRLFNLIFINSLMFIGFCNNSISQSPGFIDLGSISNNESLKVWEDALLMNINYQLKFINSERDTILVENLDVIKEELKDFVFHRQDSILIASLIAIPQKDSIYNITIIEVSNGYSEYTQQYAILAKSHKNIVYYLKSSGKWKYEKTFKDQFPFNEINSLLWNTRGEIFYNYRYVKISQISSRKIERKILFSFNKNYMVLLEPFLMHKF
jgi:hypothetical protein